MTQSRCYTISERTVARSIPRIISGAIFTRLSAIIVPVFFVPCCYEIGCLRYLPARGRKKEDTVVTSRSSERNELYHTAGISIGKREAREKTLYTLSSLPALSRLVVPRCSTLPASSNVTRASAGSADVKIFINCVAVFAGRDDDTSPEKVGWCT